jgi:hypothetical protein
MRALSQDPNQRHQSAADFADALEDAAHRAGISIASTRKVAKFVEQSGAHDKVDIRELAALKKASGPGIPAPRSSAASLPSYPSHSDMTPLSSPQLVPSSGPVPSTPSVPSMPSFTSQPSVASVTATEATYSARPDRRSSTTAAIAIGMVVALLGLGGGYFLSQGGASTPAAGADETAVDAPLADGDEAPADEPPAAASAESAAASPAGAPSASAAAASASAAPTTAPPARTSPVVMPPPKPKPKPKSGPYNPNRL